MKTHNGVFLSLDAVRLPADNLEIISPNPMPPNGGIRTQQSPDVTATDCECAPDSALDERPHNCSCPRIRLLLSGNHGSLGLPNDGKIFRTAFHSVAKPKHGLQSPDCGFFSISSFETGFTLCRLWPSQLPSPDQLLVIWNHLWGTSEPNHSSKWLEARRGILLKLGHPVHLWPNNQRTS
jgi:hypothetical protein